MKILFTAAIIFLCVGISLFAKNTTLTEAQSMLNMKSIEFIENKGQIADQNGNVNYDVLFISEVPYGTVTIRRDGISCSFIKRNQEKVKAQRDKLLSKEKFDKQSEFEDVAIPTEIYRVDMRLKGSNFNPEIEKFEITEDYNNYYLAHCPDGITHVRKFKTVKLSDVYPNIDFVVYANNDGLVQYDFVVKPGANPNLINFAFEGAKDVEITADGTLKVETPLGSIEQKAPVAYQPYDLNDYLNSREYNNSPQSPVPSPQTHFTKNSDNTISFNITNYDQSKPLIIDPPTRLWGTYYGGSRNDKGYSVATDDSDYVYLAGQTESSNAIATAGSHQSSLGGASDAFLVKFNSDGVRQWGTYYGGDGDEYGSSVTTDDSGYVYLAGQTESRNAIATAGSHQSSYGFTRDAFLAKFNSNGVREWGTYYGGSNYEEGNSVATDGSGFVYLAGGTSSSNAIATAGSHQSSFGGNYDAFLVKFNSNGVRQWGTYYGGSSGDYGNSVATDVSGYVYLAGKTESSDSIATAGSHQSSIGGAGDAFLVKFNSNGVREWGTYYGGSGEECYYNNCSVATDGLGYVYLAGETQSSDSIASTSSHQSSFGGCNWDAFLVKFNSNGVRQWGTYYGGSDEDNGYSVATDALGNVYLAGFTESSDSIATAGSHKSSIGDVDMDAFLVKFNSNGVRQWGTYYGGSNSDYGFSVATDGSDYVYLAGATVSSDSIATAGSHQSSLGDGGEVVGDAFLVKFESENSYIFEEEIVNDYFSIEYFPNPFNSILNVKLSVKKTSYFILDILNYNGEKIERIESNLLLEGDYNFTSNTQKYSDGAYFLRVTTNENQFIYKLIHLK